MDPHLVRAARLAQRDPPPAPQPEFPERTHEPLEPAMPEVEPAPQIPWQPAPVPPSPPAPRPEIQPGPGLRGTLLGA